MTLSDYIRRKKEEAERKRNDRNLEKRQHKIIEETAYREERDKQMKLHAQKSGREKAKQDVEKRYSGGGGFMSGMSGGVKSAGKYYDAFGKRAVGKPRKKKKRTERRESRRNRGGPPSYFGESLFGI